jgi:hypothetical protein
MTDVPSTIAPWQPIKTAPQDGTEILVRTDDDCMSLVAWGSYRIHSYLRDPGWYVRQGGDWDFGQGEYANCRIVYDPTDWLKVS